MHLEPMTRAHATEVVTWRYPPPFDCYDMTDADPDRLSSPDSHFYALIDDEALVGFRSFGDDGRVPGGTYDSSALDTGGGLRPDLLGHGIGYSAIQSGLAFGRLRYRPIAFRVTVASFNIRALRVLDRCGFTQTAEFEATTDGRRYKILVRPERERSATGQPAV